MIDDDEVCLRERYAEDRSTCGCAKCRASLATDTDELLALGKGITEGLVALVTADDHERLCQGREYTCTCGYDERVDAAVTQAAAAIAELRAALEFYANPEIYEPHPHGPAFDRRDLSSHARAALKPTSNERDG